MLTNLGAAEYGPPTLAQARKRGLVKRGGRKKPSPALSPLRAVAASIMTPGPVSLSPIRSSAQAAQVPSSVTSFVPPDSAYQPVPKKTLRSILENATAADYLRAIVGLVVTFYLGRYVWRKVSASGSRGRSRRVVRNPRTRKYHSDPDVQRALDFREDFHWGHPARGVKSMTASPIPKVGVQLGKVAEITYRTNKKGERAKLFTHDFESPHPTLVMDANNKRLHFVGGGYTVTADGITG